MVKFTAKVTEAISGNRLLTLSEEKEMPEVSVASAGSIPDLRSTGNLEEGQEVTVTIKDETVWEVEAGENLNAGASVEIGDGGVVVSSSGGGFGYVSEAVEAGEVAKVVRRAGGGAAGPAGPAGPKGDKGDKGNKGNDGFGTEEQYNDIISRLVTLENGAGEGA